jgi:isopenicillin-N epimerase
MVTSQFPFRPGKIPMNAANLSPSPRVVSERVVELTRDEDSDISNPNRSKFSAPADECGTITLGAGDEVVLWDQNHQCNNAAWDVRAAQSTHLKTM